MSLLDCYEKIWGCCDASISPSKFNAFSAETEEKINDLQEQIDNIEISGITYEGGDYIDITNKTISVTGITPNDFASKDDLEELSGKVDTLSGKVDTLSATVETITGITGDVSSLVEDINEIKGDITNIEGDIINVQTTLEGKQDALTEGSFIDITNNVISAKIIILTQAQWAALVDRDPTVLYLIREN